MVCNDRILVIFVLASFETFLLVNKRNLFRFQYPRSLLSIHLDGLRNNMLEEVQWVDRRVYNNNIVQGNYTIGASIAGTCTHIFVNGRKHNQTGLI